MTVKRPLVIDAGDLRQARTGEDLDMDVSDRVYVLERQVQALAFLLALNDIELPPDLCQLAEEYAC